MVVKAPDFVIAEDKAAKDKGIQAMIKWTKKGVPPVHRIVVRYVPRETSPAKKSRSKKVVKK